MDDQNRPIRPNDQWRRGGICQLCRRQAYCAKRCTANKELAQGAVRAYINRMTHIPEIRESMRRLNEEGEYDNGFKD